eukprot:GHVU01071219.1.p1 GENE.GHVU01071219.1~~GHVU01071219.1.p1  ORF type:complete len:265 (+),score=23.34 GHVU01071219.1:739-1533(+)
MDGDRGKPPQWLNDETWKFFTPLKRNDKRYYDVRCDCCWDAGGKDIITMCRKVMAQTHLKTCTSYLRSQALRLAERGGANISASGEVSVSTSQAGNPGTASSSCSTVLPPTASGSSTNSTVSLPVAAGSSSNSAVSPTPAAGSWSDSTPFVEASSSSSRVPPHRGSIASSRQTQQKRGWIDAFADKSLTPTQQAAFNEATLQWVAVKKIPLSVCEGPEFRQVLKVLRPAAVHQAPTADTLGGPLLTLCGPDAKYPVRANLGDAS